MDHLSNADTVYNKAKKVIGTMQDKCCYVLFDIGTVLFTNSTESKPLNHLLDICNFALNANNCKVVIALSSGDCTMLSYPQRALYSFFMMLNSKRKCQFQSFNLEEAKEYLDKRGVTAEFKVIQEMTNLNPLLLSSIPKSPDLDIGHVSKIHKQLCDNVYSTCTS